MKDQSKYQPRDWERQIVSSIAVVAIFVGIVAAIGLMPKSVQAQVQGALTFLPFVTTTQVDTNESVAVAPEEQSQQPDNNSGDNDTNNDNADNGNTNIGNEVNDANGGQFNELLSYRSLDGSGNNQLNPQQGMAGLSFARVAPATYADGLSAMQSGPNPRYISNRIYNDDAENIFSENDVTHWGFVWGQFIDHTIGLTESGSERVSIPFDSTDPLEQFQNDLGVISFTRSAIAPNTGATTPREQINTIGSYIDGFAVYGGTEERLDWLRAGPLDGDPTNNSAALLHDDGYLPTVIERGDASTAPAMDLFGAQRLDPTSAVVAGDVRANENFGLTAVQTLFMREHNRIVSLLPDTMSEELKFTIARRVVGATQQYITYEEFLPAFGIALDSYAGYDPTVDSSVTNEFSTVGYRAHSMIHGEFEMEADLDDYTRDELAALEAQGVEVDRGNNDVEFAIPLNIAFGQPQLLKQIGLDAALLGLASEAQYANDEMIDNQLRSVLFQIPSPNAANPAACLDGDDLPDCYTVVNDLGVLDLVRAYDHGIPNYNALRMAYGLAPVTSFTEITGEETEFFPSDQRINAADPINDPSILDIVASFNADGEERGRGRGNGGGQTVAVERRTTLAARLRAIYGLVDAIDPFTGMISEVHVEGTEFGELQLAIWKHQFTALRDGDRFFYGNDSTLATILLDYGIDYRQTLANVIVNNSGFEAREVPNNVFVD